MPEDQDPSPDVVEPTDDELRANRARMLELIAQAQTDDPELPYGWGCVGEWSFHLYLLLGDEDDLRQAADALDRALAGEDADEVSFVWRLLRGQVLIERYDLADAPDPDLLARAERELLDALAGLTPDSPHTAGNAPLARLLVARVAAGRLRLAESVAAATPLPETAVCRQLDALADHAPGSDEAAELHDRLGDLVYARYEVTEDPEDLVLAAEHYRAALVDAPPGLDAPLTRYGLATALFVHGRATANRRQLELARIEFDRAFADGDDEGAEAPWWTWEARVRSVFIRAVLYFHWKDRVQVGPALYDLDRLLARPDSEARLRPMFADTFGRLLYDRAVERDDDVDRDRALALMRSALRGWQPEDGDLVPVALLLATCQKTRYQRDPDPDRLTDIVDATTVLLDRDVETWVRQTARPLLAWARREQVRRELVEEDGTLAVLEAQAREDLSEILEGVRHGRIFLDLDESDDFPFVGEVAGTANARRTFDTLHGQWRDTEPGCCTRPALQWPRGAADRRRPRLGRCRPTCPPS
ncbi:hypothetical protein [Embleya sp. NBC_00896]|uniref:hypothetical protein n=1 Tax=Embleya sp. NBC_00896 TaxID=2975961 RepID=UPI00386E851D|nr:hypothetical protein OG928_04715 [Embleya sp. NBC_00896]